MPYSGDEGHSGVVPPGQSPPTWPLSALGSPSGPSRNPHTGRLTTVAFRGTRVVGGEKRVGWLDLWRSGDFLAVRDLRCYDVKPKLMNLVVL